MHLLRPLALSTFFICAPSFICATPVQAATTFHQSFAFGEAVTASKDVRAVKAFDSYSQNLGYGFEGDVPLIEGKSAAGRPFYFSVDVPEGNYRVTVTLGADEASDTTVKAELRRLMLEDVKVKPKASATRSFVVNVRTPQIPEGAENGPGVVKLKAPREVETEARAWDQRITLEFAGNPGVRALSIDAVDVPTLYLLGDSTVCDQSGEPYASWGQMLPRFFKDTVAVANHGESGESVSAAQGARRFDKILSLIKPGDYFLVQFGHNDMKQKASDPEAPLKYKQGLIDWVTSIKAKGATPVIITPMNRHTFEGGVVTNSLAEYPQMAREAAAETGTALIDLNALSKILYEALGEKPSLALFEHTADYAKMDATHHSPYGAYELAKLVIEGIRANRLKIAGDVVEDLPTFDPRHPDTEADFKVPPSRTFAAAKPFGS